MFFSGFVAERVSLRYFLSLGMILSGLLCYMFGLAKTLNIHYLWYFIVVQVLGGVIQSTGFPSVVTLVGRWCGRSKRGLIFGIWNSHTPIGNIIGTLIAAHFIEDDWSLSFLLPGALTGLVGFIIFLFLVDHPAKVQIVIDAKGLYHRVENDHDSSNESDNSDSQSQLFTQEDSPMLEERADRSTEESGQDKKAVGFLKALIIPGVIEYSLCLFFSKLVSYTFLYWLPNYIQNATTMGAKKSADLSTLFDVGGIAGAVLAGVISDLSGRSALTCGGMLILAVPTMLIYERWGSINMTMNIGMLLLCGALVNGPYALITTSVSTELGSKTKGDAHALATVTAIIDGTGSLGAAVGPLLAGVVSQGGWERVFYMLMVSDILALFMLIRLIVKDFTKKKSTSS
uniref:Sugar phosphate exchanger 3 n=1 Tax=Xenopsylla cheopis TaxID=163159 RepID=A0A6M2DZD8_XENCH